MFEQVECSLSAKNNNFSLAEAAYSKPAQVRQKSLEVDSLATSIVFDFA